MRIMFVLVLIALVLPRVTASGADGKPAKEEKGASAKTTTGVEAKPGPLTEIPARLTVKQRTTTIVSGSDDKLQITIDDITRGQVIVSLSHTKHGVLFGPTSMRSGDAKKFDLQSTAYQIRLKALHNALIGDDFAEFVIGYPSQTLTEPEKVQKLIQLIEDLPDEVLFVRNGKERSPKSEAEFLRKRAEAWKGKELTAVAFIERLCAKASGEKPYRVRVAGDGSVSMEYYLREKLREIESGD